MNADTERVIRKIQTSIRNAEAARNDDARIAARSFLIKRTGELVARRDALLRKIEEGWTWLEPYDYEDPAVREQEDRFVAWNAELLQITDALDAAEAVVSGRGAA